LFSSLKGKVYSLISRCGSHLFGLFGAGFALGFPQLSFLGLALLMAWLFWLGFWLLWSSSSSESFASAVKNKGRSGRTTDRKTLFAHVLDEAISAVRCTGRNFVAAAASVAVKAMQCCELHLSL
tara:strand:- start:55 stop:426 length:372 start_codon:yes stop_codon:yes gene_type:complete